MWERSKRMFCKLLSALFKKYGPGLFVDVGAYVGLYSVLAAKFGWRVLAFEPNPLSLLLLKYNLLMNRVNN